MPKAKLRKSSNSKPDADLGRLNLRSYVDSKRKQTQKERKEYERKFLSRYKAPKAKLRKLSGLKPEPPSVKVDRNKVRKEYEQKYLARYQKQRNTKSKKKK